MTFLTCTYSFMSSESRLYENLGTLHFAHPTGEKRLTETIITSNNSHAIHTDSLRSVHT